MVKKDVFAQRRPKRNSSYGQINFKSDTSDQAIEKAFHIVLNLIISTALSYHADFIVNDDQVKNALIKFRHNEKEQKDRPATYDDILIKQSLCIIFRTNGAEATNEFLLRKFCQYETNFD